jgi:hypothetical protein
LYFSGISSKIVSTTIHNWLYCCLAHWCPPWWVCFRRQYYLSNFCFNYFFISRGKDFFVTSIHYLLRLGFTPVLSEFYTDLVSEDASALELIFLSSDHGPREFSEYWGSMSFDAVPFEASSVKNVNFMKLKCWQLESYIALLNL